MVNILKYKIIIDPIYGNNMYQATKCFMDKKLKDLCYRHEN